MKPLNYNHTVLNPDGTHAELCNISGGSGGSGGLELTELWDNPTPGSSFGEKEVEINATDYRFIIVKYLPVNGYTKEKAGYMSNLINASSINANNNGMTICTLLLEMGGEIYTRNISCSTENKIRFSSAFKGTSAKNDYIIPVTVYGIK